VWITNRDAGSYVHLAANGKLVCSSPYATCYTRAAAVDPRGHGWIGCNDTSDLIEVSGTETDGTVDVKPDPEADATVKVPRCKELGRLKVQDLPLYGLAIAGGNVLWATGRSGSVAKIDYASRTILGVYSPKDDPKLAQSPCWDSYGITVDLGGNPWLANYSCNNVVKLDGQTGAILGVFTGGPENMISPRALGIDRSGHVWVSENGAGYVNEFEPDGHWVKRVDLTSCAGANGPLGTASDSEGNLWTVLQDSNMVIKYQPDGHILGCYPDQRKFNSPYTYSDFTGASLALVGSDVGRTRVRFDHPSAVHWPLAAFSLTTPPGSGVCLRARSAADAAGLGAAAWSATTCPRSASPGIVDIQLDEAPGGLRVGRGAALEIELTLSASVPSASPIVAQLSVAATP
jgi:hypothetical protein